MCSIESQLRSDPFDLERFVLAQREDYSRALAELKAGRKHAHWMWYIFPQMRGLGSSVVSQRYGISSLAEAKAYLAHPVLGPRLIECAGAVLSHCDDSALAIFGSPDDMKLRSSATLFARASPSGSVFERIVGQFFAGEEDAATIRILSAPAERIP